MTLESTSSAPHVPAEKVDPFDPAIIAADYVLAAIREPEARKLVVLALSAGWLTPAEFEQLKPLANAVAYLAGLPAPTHREGGSR